MLDDEYAEKVKLRKVIGGIPPITLLTSIRGNCPGRGTYVHPDLAMAIAMWAHPPFLAKEILDGVFFSMKNQ